MIYKNKKLYEKKNKYKYKYLLQKYLLKKTKVKNESAFPPIFPLEPFCVRTNSSGCCNNYISYLLFPFV